MKSPAWNRIWTLISDEWQKKLIALAFAVFIWYYVNSLSYTEENLALPIQYRNLPSDLMIVESSEPTASFIIKGKVEQIENIKQKRAIKPIVNLEQAATGTHNYKIEISIDEPQSDVIINLLKDRVKLKIDKTIIKIVPIQPIFTGSLKDGYLIDDVIMDHRLITIKGPSELISQLNFLETAPIAITNLTNDFSQSLGINVPKMISIIGEEKVNILVRVVKKQ
jgi:YbbR domain-containing protein